MNNRNKDLKSSSNDVAHEISMFFDTKRQIDSTNDDDVVVKNAFSESFYIHFRNLYEFFTQETRNYLDDVIAKDYVQNWDNKCLANLKTEHGEVHKFIAHITTTRHSKMPCLDQNKIFNKMKPVIEKFLHDVPVSLSDKKISELKTQPVLPPINATATKSSTTPENNCFLKCD